MHAGVCRYKIGPDDPRTQLHGAWGCKAIEGGHKQTLHGPPNPCHNPTEPAWFPRRSCDCKAQSQEVAGHN